MATIYDIAKVCEVSTATVSYVLNNKGNEKRISKTTQKRVLEAAEELGYIRVSSKQLDHPTIAIYWLQNFLEMTMPSVIKGINTAVTEEILPVEVVIRPFEQGCIRRQKTLWDATSCDAAIIVGPDAEDLEYLKSHPTTVDTILFNRELTGYSSVTIDHMEAGELAAKHAVLKGGKDISLVLDPSDLFGLNCRGKAIMEGLKRQDVDIANQIFYCPNGIDDGYELGWEMVRKNQLRKVIITIYDMVGLGIMSALNESGITVGEEVQVLSISSGLSRLFARSTPPMTVVDLKIEEISQRCVRMGIDLATGKLTAPQQTVIRPQIIYRQSCPMDIAPL